VTLSLSADKRLSKMTGHSLVKAHGSGDWLADIFDVMDDAAIEGIVMADELVLKDEVFAVLEAQGEVGELDDVPRGGGDLCSDGNGSASKRTREEVSGTGGGENGKHKKSQREKRRRDALNDHFMGLSASLDPDSAEPLKTDKATVVTEAAKVIRDLRAELQRTSRSLREVSSTNENLVKEREGILQDKHKLEHQLACFMSSMPFASMPYEALPGGNAPGGKTASMQNGQRARSMMWQFPPLVVQTTTADEDAKLRAPVA